ncbi:hypothetical protein AHAS_Ahas07G0077600 [Arachis hypogaea]
MTRKLSTLEFERFAVDGNHYPGFMLRSTWTIVGECCRFEMERHGEGSSDFSVQWTNGWSTDSTDDDEKSAARLLETEEGIHVAADNPYGDEELGSAVLTVAALESTEFNSVEEAYKEYVAFAKATGFAV